ncbi:methylthioadenosine phosphorylase [Compostibacillus humi]|uniref:Probable 6-oxopurine nucleoside phosphorylase n=1 Tax=Compostibacillus humi TaxID=1245525 RepID=A0A8J2TTQ3_9BACI|nr:MTAP family purine nucleoside phosphorylase [Compostibacillus humi]GFZ82064.1 methylthioadenosine phosphorylase [Compostibacillus humi]
MKIGIIGGTGFYNLIDGMEEQAITTNYGDVHVYRAYKGNNEVIFLPRHGKYHDKLAPQVNYRANMKALRMLEVDRVVAVTAVGAINKKFTLGTIAILDQFIDFTTRIRTYGKFSADINNPFCPEMQKIIIQAAKNIGQKLEKEAKLICVEGPRYETKAEIELFHQWGMDVVGMTTSTEASLARELGICYAAVAHVTNMAAGISDQKLSLKAHKEAGKINNQKLKELITEALELMKPRESCSCIEPYEKAVLAGKI